MRYPMGSDVCCATCVARKLKLMALFPAPCCPALLRSCTDPNCQRLDRGPGHGSVNRRRPSRPKQRQGAGWHALVARSVAMLLSCNSSLARGPLAVPLGGACGPQFGGASRGGCLPAGGPAWDKECISTPARPGPIVAPAARRGEARGPAGLVQARRGAPAGRGQAPRPCSATWSTADRGEGRSASSQCSVFSHCGRQFA